MIYVPLQAGMSHGTKPALTPPSDQPRVEMALMDYDGYDSPSEHCRGRRDSERFPATRQRLAPTSCRDLDLALRQGNRHRMCSPSPPKAALPRHLIKSELR